MEKYTYSAGGKSKEGVSFKCFLVGSDPSHYMPAITRGKHAYDAEKKFQDKSIWKMTKAVFDSKMNSSYISGTIKFCINLVSTNWQNLDAVDGAVSCATYIKPAYSVADSVQIHS